MAVVWERAPLTIESVRVGSAAVQGLRRLRRPSHVGDMGYGFGSPLEIQVRRKFPMVRGARRRSWAAPGPAGALRDGSEAAWKAKN